MKKNIVIALLASVAAVSSAYTHAADAFPNKPIRLVVNFGAGGSTDIAARIVAKKLASILGQGVVVENRSGGGGTIGPSYLAKQEPDGYTIGLTAQGAIATAPWMYKVTYDTDDFDYIGAFSKYRYVFIVGADTPYKNIQDVVDAAKKSSKPLLFGTPGPQTNFVFPMLTKQTGAEFEQVLYKSGMDTTVGVASNQVPMAVVISPEAWPQMQAGKVRMIASATGSRWSEYPDVPTVAEQGFDATIEGYLALGAPKGVPAPVLAKLRDAVEQTMADESVRTEMERAGMEATYMKGPEYGELMRKEKAKAKVLIQELGLATQE